MEQGHRHQINEFIHGLGKEQGDDTDNPLHAPREPNCHGLLQEAWLSDIFVFADKEDMRPVRNP